MIRLPYLDILRPVNLLIIAATQLFVYGFLIVPGLYEAGTMPSLSFWQLLLLILCTCCLAASGNIINDIYDIKVDAINKPGKIFIPDPLTKGQAMLYFWMLLVAGFGIAVFLGMQTSLEVFIPLYPAAAFMLWLYSARVKHFHLGGNIVVSVFCAGVIFIVFLPDLNTNMAPVYRQSVFIYAAFAGILTFFRELIKDIEDMEGDRRTGSRTFPISHGIVAGKLLGTGIIAILIATILYWEYAIIREHNTWRTAYIVLLVIIPSIYLIFKLLKAINKQDFHGIATLSKGIMVSGSLVIVLI